MAVSNLVHDKPWSMNAYVASSGSDLNTLSSQILMPSFEVWLWAAGQNIQHMPSNASSAGATMLMILLDANTAWLLIILRSNSRMYYRVKNSGTWLDWVASSTV